MTYQGCFEETRGGIYLYLHFKCLSPPPFCSWFPISFLLSIPCHLFFLIDLSFFQNICFFPLPISTPHSYNSLFHLYSGITLFFFPSPLPPSLDFYTTRFLNLPPFSHVSSILQWYLQKLQVWMMEIWSYLEQAWILQALGQLGSGHDTWVRHPTAWRKGDKQ